MKIVGNRTQTTALAAIIFNLLSLFGVIDPETLSPEAVSSINDGLMPLIGLFLGLKIKNNRSRSTP